MAGRRMQNAPNGRRYKKDEPGDVQYDTLSEGQLSELKNWYQAWLDGTNTQTIPEKPEWLT